MLHTIIKHPDTRGISLALLTLSMDLDPDFLLNLDNLSIIENIFDAIFSSRNPIETSEAISLLYTKGLLTGEYELWNFPKFMAYSDTPFKAAEQFININTKLLSSLEKHRETIVHHQNPLLLWEGIMKLRQARYAYNNQYYIDFLKNSVNPKLAAEALTIAIKAELTEQFTQSELNRIIRPLEKPALIIEAIIKLQKTNALTGNGEYSPWSFISAITNHEEPVTVAEALIKLHRNNLMCTMHQLPYLVSVHKEPMVLAEAYIKLHESDFFVHVSHTPCVLMRQKSPAALAVSVVNKHKKPIPVVEALIALTNAGLLDSYANRQYIKQIAQFENPQIIANTFINTNTANQHRVLLMKQLMKYIIRIESYPKQKQGFLFFSQSRIANREANYLLANKLLTNLIFSLDLPIQEIFRDLSAQRIELINTHNIHNHDDKGINSNELNAIIAQAEKGTVRDGPPPSPSHNN